MTREEAKRILYVYRAVNLVDASHREAFDMAISELEQEPILDKIREWIDKPVIRDEYSQRQNDYCDGYEFVCNQIREIIDKYKIESEG